QAEDGIRDRNVTGVQTCALPIYGYDRMALFQGFKVGFKKAAEGAIGQALNTGYTPNFVTNRERPKAFGGFDGIGVGGAVFGRFRSEERRVGKESMVGFTEE